jgi:Mn2+/Fe2+ NRAMP family transporter
MAASLFESCEFARPIVPTISFKGEYLAALIAVLGTTISPYLLFWQSGEEVEQMESEPLKKAPQQAPEQFQRIKIDTYLVLAVATLIGLTLNFTRLDPIKALVWAAIINGITAAPVMCFMMLLASRRKVMGKLTLPFYLKTLGWLATAIMAVAAVGMLLTYGK